MGVRAGDAFVVAGRAGGRGGAASSGSQAPRACRNTSNADLRSGGGAETCVASVATAAGASRASRSTPERLRAWRMSAALGEGSIGVCSDSTLAAAACTGGGSSPLSTACARSASSGARLPWRAAAASIMGSIVWVGAVWPGCCATVCSSWAVMDAEASAGATWAGSPDADAEGAAWPRVTRAAPVRTPWTSIAMGRR